MIPSILGPDINIICEKSTAELQRVEPDGQELGHLDPNGGFMVLMSCTEEVVLRLASTICFISQDIEQSNFWNLMFGLRERHIQLVGRR